MTVQQLREALTQFDDHLNVNLRVSYDDDVYPVHFLAEDLYDSETNSILESVVILAKTS